MVIGFIVVKFTTTGSDRWDKYMAGLTNPNMASDHMQRVFEAISRGGLFGVGIGNSITKFTGLPVPWTDSIYAVIVEETGLVGGLAVLGLYFLILWRGLQIANRAPDQLGRMLASGVTFWIVFEAILNMGVMVNLFPFRRQCPAAGQLRRFEHGFDHDRYRNFDEYCAFEFEERVSQ